MTRNPKSQKNNALERDIQRTILDWLALYRIFHYRQNTGGMIKGRHFVRFGVKGAPDIVAVVKGQYVGIEIKKPGEDPSPDQIEFGKSLEAAGGKYIVARSLEDVMRNIPVGT